jgi:hypothetical protein
MTAAVDVQKPWPISRRTYTKMPIINDFLGYSCALITCGPANHMSLRNILFAFDTADGSSTLARQLRLWRHSAFTGTLVFIIIIIALVVRLIVSG